MRLLEANSDGSRTVDFTEDETRMIFQGIGHLTSLKPEHYDTHFRGWLGAGQDVLRDLEKCFQGGGSNITRLTRLEQRLVVKALADLIEGFAPPDWEFQTITGFTRNEMRPLLHKLHRLTVNNAEDLKRDIVV